MRTNFILAYSFLVLLFIDWLLGGFIFRLPFEFAFILFGFITWILPGIFLWKLEKGKKIYLTNLVAGLGVLLLFYLVNYKSSSSTDLWGNIGNVELLLLVIFGWLIWGWILLFYSGMKKFTNTKK